MTDAYREVFEYLLLINALGKPVRIILIIALAWLALRIGGVAIQRLLTQREGRGIAMPEQRAKTLSGLLSSLLRYTVYFIAGVTILDELTGKISTILASAGIVGLAISFGSQSLVKDVITGFFIIFENQFAVGEYIQAAGVEGIVEEIGLRMTKLRDFNGELHYVPNGEIGKVTNHSRGTKRALVEIGVAYEEDLDRVLKVMADVCQQAARDLPDIVEGPDVLGVVALGESEVTIRVVAMTRPLEKWKIERELLKRIKLAFDQAGIEIPYPRRIVLSSVPAKARD
ncbi:MAG: mechanosensitive ion channel family protein [Firmicutes bacterium]|nr:mechanosensitive ion channel family protein [Bacillota bacterium]